MMKKKIVVRPKKMATQLKKSVSHDEDFYTWTKQQAELLKKEEFERLDICHLLEEIRSLGNNEEDKLESHLRNVLTHMLKIKYQPSYHTRSWDLSIKNSIFHANKTLKKNPGLKGILAELFKDAYYSARLEAAQQTNLDEKIFPLKCPWKIEEILTTTKK